MRPLLNHSSLKRGAALGGLLILSACVANGFDPRAGSIAISVKWPQQNGYQVQAIPEGTARVDVVIVGEGITDGQPLKISLTPGPNNTTTEFLAVPIGPKVVQAKAFDVSNQLLATGESAIGVLPNQEVPARIVLAPVTPLATATPDTGSPVPTPSASAPDFIMTTVAGGLEGQMDSTNPLKASFRYPSALVYDSKHLNLYIADTGNHLIRRFNLATSAVDTVAGSSGTLAATSGGPSPLPGSLAITPAGMALAPDGSLVFCDRDNNVIRKLQTDGSLLTLLGTSKAGDAQQEGLQGPLAALNTPMALAFDASSTLYVADMGNNKVRRMDSSGSVTTLAGTGAASSTGDNGLAGRATLNAPCALVLDAKGQYLYIAEAAGRRVRRIQLGSGIITTVVGTGVSGVSGEGGPAGGAQLGLPLALAFDPTGHLLIADGWGLAGANGMPLIGVTSRVLELSDDNRLVRIAGQSAEAVGFSGDNSDAKAASLNNPAGLISDAEGNIYMADSYNNRLRLLIKAIVSPSPSPLPSPSPAPTTPPSSAKPL